MAQDTDLFDFFVSYARRDNAAGWVTGFLEALLNAHRQFSGGRTLTYFFDKQDIRSFDDWRHRIFNEGLARSRLFLAFISPSYFASEWCRREWRAWIDTEIAKHILSSGAAPIYFVEVPGFVGQVPGLHEQVMRSEQEVARHVAELCGLHPPHDSFIAAAGPIVRQMRERRQITVQFAKPFADEGLASLRRDDLRRVLTGLAQDLVERAGCVRRAAESANTVPPYNRNFSGRLDELLLLRERLKDDRAGVVCGVHGLGGMGKTELAFTYAQAFAGAYPGGRFLVPCEGKGSLREAALSLGDFPDFRARISDEERKTPGSHFVALARCLIERLAEKGHILLVLDNVTDAALASPQETDALTSLGPNLHLLATTRLPAPRGANWLMLGELPEADALDLLEKHRRFVDEMEEIAARKIVRQLGGFALAIELVAACLAEHPGLSYVHLAASLSLDDLDVFAEDKDVTLRRHNHEKRLTAVLGPVLNDLKPAERRALEYAALLPPDCVALPWLRALVEKDMPDALKPARLAGDPWRETWEQLGHLALFTRVELETAEPRIVRVHRLVQDLVRRETPKGQLQERVNTSLKLLRERYEALEKTTQWRDARWELEPFEALAWLSAVLFPEDASPATLLCRLGLRYFALAEWSRAEPLVRRALEIHERRCGPDCPEVASDMNALAALLLATNRPAEAEPLMRRALAIDRRRFGANHPNVGRDMNSLAHVLQAMNRVTEAEPLYRQALKIFQRGNVPDHFGLATSLIGLAAWLQTANRLAEAEPLIRRALKLDVQRYGPDHPEVAIDLNNLAELFLDAKRLAEAEPLLRHALEIDEGSYGLDHPNVAIRLNNLACVLRHTNRFVEAESLFRRALTIDERSYGPDHPNVARDLNNLAQLLLATGRLQEAVPLVRRTVMIFVQFARTTGRQHRYLIDALGGYALVLETMGWSQDEILAELRSVAPELFRVKTPEAQ